jgi:carboxymethylenebutenolidase
MNMKIKVDQVNSGYEGYFAGPERGAEAGVIVVQEIYGVNKEVRRITDHFAGAGYASLAPDLMWRSKPWLDFAYEDRDGARKVILSLDYAALVNDIVSAIECLRGKLEGAKRVGVVGLGWGGKPAIEAATRSQADASISFYPGTLDLKSLDVVNAFKGPLQFHFASKDDRTPLAFRTALRAALVERDDSEVYVYEGAEHGFANRDRGEFGKAYATIADQRQDEFLRRCLSAKDGK